MSNQNESVPVLVQVFKGIFGFLAIMCITWGMAYFVLTILKLIFI